MPRVAMTRVMPSATSIVGAPLRRMSIRLPKRWPSCIADGEEAGAEDDSCTTAARRSDQRRARTGGAPDAATSSRHRSASLGSRVAAAMSRSGRVDADVVVVLELGDHAPVAQHHDAVAEPQHLLELGRDEQHATCRRRPARRRASGSRPWRRRRCRGSARRGSAACGSVSSQRASSTFCWLPPREVAHQRLGSAGRMSRASM